MKTALSSKTFVTSHNHSVKMLSLTIIQSTAHLHNVCYVIQDINITSFHVHTNNMSDLVNITVVARVWQQIPNHALERVMVQLNWVIQSQQHSKCAEIIWFGFKTNFCIVCILQGQPCLYTHTHTHRNNIINTNLWL